MRPLKPGNEEALQPIIMKERTTKGGCSREQQLKAQKTHLVPLLPRIAHLINSLLRDKLNM